MKTIKLTMQGLHCASCAQKIEHRAGMLPYVNDVLLNFTVNELRFRMDDAAPSDTLSRVEEIIHRTERGITLTQVTVADDTGQERTYTSVADAVLSVTDTARATAENHPHRHDDGLTPLVSRSDAHTDESGEHVHKRLGGNGHGLALLIMAAALTAVSFVPALPAAATTALQLAAIALSGYPIFIEGIKKLLRLDIEEELLMMIAVIAACALGAFPEAAMVTLLFRAGTFLEDIAVARSKKSINRLTSIRPDIANLMDAQGKAAVVAADTVPVGSTILVKPGERVPLDAVVIAGSSDTDNSVITGESVPVPVSEGSHVLSGTVNGAGLLTCKTTGDFKSSTASRIIELVESSIAKKGTTERLITRFARYYTPIVIVLAVLIAAFPPLFGMGDFSTWLYRSLIFLVASCPCALVISVPLGFFAGIGSISRLGVLIKGGRYLEALSRADTVVFDKTGTLTSGRLRVAGVTSVSDAS
ncbi:MAG: heavy metal translocating P-type ATPase, partial [Acetanaerobacterium sp.]